MCGIAGFTCPQPNAAIILSRMMASIAHRGPDDQGTHIDTQVALGHQRLSIIDLKTGHQPMANADKSVWIVYNGEIYNYVELSRDLAARGRRFHTSSDTEAILHLYDEYGEDCVDHLNGMFAFIIYDNRRGRLFAARDRFGIKPFYYALVRNQFVFASEIKALLQHPEIPAKVNHRALTEYILLQLCMGTKTLFEGVHKLEPAHCLTYTLATQACRIREYWRPTYEPDRRITESSAVEGLRHLLRDSVRLQLRSDVPVGTYLSGGIDSSLITCLAADQTSSTIKTFTGGFRDPGPFDETVHAKTVADSRTNLEAHYIYPTAGDFSSSISSLIYHMDEPAGGPGLFAQYTVAALAAKQVKVILGGQGGDEIFGGYVRYFLLFIEQLLKDRIAHPTHLTAQDWSLLWKNRDVLQSYFPSIKKLIRGGRWMEPWAMRYYRLLRHSENAHRYYPPDVLDPRHVAEIECEFETLFNRPETMSLHERSSYFDFKNLLPALLQVEDRVSMAVSLESRVPLLDHRIVEYLSRLTYEVKFKDGEMKHLLKRVAKNIIPDSILARRDKIGFAVPLVQWARGPLRSYLRETLTSTQARSRGIMYNDRILQTIGREQSFGRDVWGALCLELWFARFIDVVAPKGVS